MFQAGPDGYEPLKALPAWLLTFRHNELVTTLQAVRCTVPRVNRCLLYTSESAFTDKGKLQIVSAVASDIHLGTAAIERHCTSESQYRVLYTMTTTCSAIWSADPDTCPFKFIVHILTSCLAFGKKASQQIRFTSDLYLAASKLEDVHLQSA